MSAFPLRDLLGAVRDLLAPHLEGAAADPEVASQARELASWLASQAERLDGAAVAAADAPAEQTEPKTEPMRLSIGGRSVVVTARVVEGGDGTLAQVGDVVELPLAETSGGGQASPEVRAPMWALRRPADWPEILRRASARARAQARACEIAARRRGRDALPEAALDELEAEVARAGGRRPWPLDPDRALPEPEWLEVCARCYELAADAAELVLSFPEWAGGKGEPPQDLLELLAEVQSALRAALSEAGIENDSTQLDLFGWIRAQAYEHQIYIPRFMKLDDRADPSQWHDLGERLETLGERLRTREQADRERRRLLGQLNHQVERLRKAEDDAERIPAWNAILRTLDAWVASGRSPTRREVCDPLVAHLDQMPDGLQVPDRARRVLEAVDDLIARRQEAPGTTEPATPRQASEVAEARRLLHGKTVLMIGGEVRRPERRRLIEDLELADLRWIPTRPHRSIEPLAQEIRKPGVDLVVVMVRWSDHAFGELRKHAEAAGIPFVSLRAGYGTNRFAHEVLEQASARLGGSDPRS